MMERGHGNRWTDIDGKTWKHMEVRYVEIYIKYANIWKHEVANLLSWVIINGYVKSTENEPNNSLFVLIFVWLILCFSDTKK